MKYDSRYLTADMVAGFARQAMVTIQVSDKEKFELQSKLDDALEELKTVQNDYRSEKVRADRMEEQVKTLNQRISSIQDRSDVYYEKLKELGVDIEKLLEESA